MAFLTVKVARMWSDKLYNSDKELHFIDVTAFYLQQSFFLTKTVLKSFQKMFPMVLICVI